MEYLSASISKIPLQVRRPFNIIFDCAGSNHCFPAERATNALIKDSQARIDEFQGGLKHMLERLTSHMQIQDLIVSSNIRKDVSHLGTVWKEEYLDNVSDGDKIQFNQIY